MITPPPSPHDRYRDLPAAPQCEFCADGKPCGQIPVWRAVRRDWVWSTPHRHRRPAVLDVCTRHMPSAVMRGADVERLAPSANPG